MKRVMTLLWGDTELVLGEFDHRPLSNGEEDFKINHTARVTTEDPE
jgi:hypothetical protein